MIRSISFVIDMLSPLSVLREHDVYGEKPDFLDLDGRALLARRSGLFTTITACLEGYNRCRFTTDSS